MEVKDRINDLERQLRELKSQLATLPTRTPTAPLRASVIRCQAKGAISSGTGLVDNITLFTGTDPRDDPTSSTEDLTIANPAGLEFDDNDVLFCFYNETAGTWEPLSNAAGDSSGGGSTLNIVHFELTADLSLAATSVAANILSSTTGASGAITVTDEEAKFSALTGYKGYAYHDGTAYRILYLEGPARFGDFIATAASSETSETITATLEDLWGNPPNGVAPASLTSITVYKLPIDADATARYVPLKNGDKFRAIWDEVEEKWKLFWYPGLRVVVRAPYSSLIDENTTSITLAVGSGETAMQLVSGFVLPADDITVTCDPDMYRSGGTSKYDGYIYAAYNHQLSTDPNACWDAGDARNFLWHFQGIGQYDPSKRQVPLQNADDTPVWHEVEEYEIAEIDVVTEITSLTISGGNLVLTYKTGTFKVVEEVTPAATATVTIPVVDPCA